MNYYEHHIGDYDEATSHLTACEDGIYSRLIRKYYSTEKPLQNDIPALQRLVRARTREEKSAVVAVLEEFFFLEGDGWHQKRCDDDLAKFLASEPERELKKANEDNRLKRHRDERAKLFKALTEAGLHAPWNIGMGELREMVAKIQKTPETPPGTQSATEPETETPPLPATAPATPATATQSPDTTTHIPEEGKDSGTSIVSGTSASRAHANPPRNAGDWASYFRDRYGVEIDVSSVHERRKVWPIFTAWCTAGLTLEQIDAAVSQARKQAKQPIAFLPSYVDRVLASQAQGVGIDNDAVNAEAAQLLFGDDTIPEVIHG